MIPATPPTTQFIPKKWEWLAVLFILSGAFAANVATRHLFPTVWADDILWSEPAINLVRTGHFTTMVWQLQPAHSFWAAQSPLYPLLLAPWLKMTGFTLLAVRSFNLVLVTIAAFLFWLAAWRFRLIQISWMRLLGIAVLLAGYGISFAYRSSRPDILGLLSLLLLWHGYSCQANRARLLLLFVCGALTSWVGVQVALYAVVSSTMAACFFKPLRREAAAVIVGAGVGGLSVLLFYHPNGSLGYFMSTLHQAAGEQINWSKPHRTYLDTVPTRLRNTLAAYVGDLSNLPMLAALIILPFSARSTLKSPKRRVIFFAVAVFLAIPLVFSLTGHFAFYYSYLIYVPLIVALLTSYSEALSYSVGVGRKVLTLFLTASVTIACLVGLPLRLVIGALSYNPVPREVYRQAIREHVKPTDVAFCDYTCFFEAKLNLDQVYSPMYSTSFVRLSPDAHDFTPQEKAGITVLIARPETMGFLSNYFGGEWAAVSKPFGDAIKDNLLFKIPVLGPRFQRHLLAPQMIRYQVQVFRRASHPP